MTTDMTADTELAALRRDVQHLKDRTAVLDCIARHARGCDRHDVDLVTAAYHDDAIDEHGSTANTGPTYGEWANASHAATSEVHTHNITTHSCQIDGDTAHAESYVIVVLLGRDGRTAQLISGRYLDRLERRDGEWRIALRRSTVEVMFTADASVLQSSSFKEQGYPKGTRDRRDLSYERPLLLDTPAPERW
jgi:hypothetical protein